MTKKILIIEDDQFLSEIYQKQFLLDHYDADIALDGESGLSKLTATKYDLVLLDLMLPKMDGLSVLEEVRKNPSTSKIPVVILSNLSEDSTVGQAIKSGANGYLVKAKYLPEQTVQEIKKYLT